jgi:hypothetical protein
MSSNRFASFTQLAGLFASLALILGCSEGGPVGDGVNVCTRCKIGAQVSMGGAGSSLAPTPCQQSETGVPVDTQTVRALGFADALDVLERDVEIPMKWSPRETSYGAPASGYTPTTTVRVRTTVSALEHRVPSMMGCADSVVATLDTRLTTGDGALDVSGQLLAPLTHGEAAPMAQGSLDLAGAKGTLMLYPNAADAPVAGAAWVGARFWPDRVRGQFVVAISKISERSSDVSSFTYDPLTADWPSDDCLYIARPMKADEPGATPDGRSAAQLVTDLQAMLDAAPKAGLWTPTGVQATVVTHVGAPTKVCSEARSWGRSVSYQTRLQVTTSDGRVHVSGDARGYASFEAGAMTNAFLEIYDTESPVLKPSEFEAKSGISGVDFGGSTGGIWHTEVYLADPEKPGVRGEIVVEGIDVDGHVTGVPYAVQGPIASFNWP